MKYQIITDSAVDLSDELIAKHHIIVLPYYISLDGEHYQKERVELKVHDLYQAMVDNPKTFPKTSSVSYNDLYETFKEYASKGTDILYFGLSAKFSSSFQNAKKAREEVLSIYKDARIEIVDSTLATCALSLFAREVARMNENDVSLDDTIKYMEKIKVTGRVFFTCSNLEYLRHGGRIGKVAALVGTTLRFNPMIALQDGELYSLGVTFTRNQATSKVIALFKNYVNENNLDLNDYLLEVGTGYDTHEGDRLKERFNVIYPEKEITRGQIGCCIGVHTGPHPIGIAFIRKYDA